MANEDANIDKNHITTVRRLMLEQLQALRNAQPGEALEQELKRSKGVSDLSQTLINSAKVEVDYMVATEQDRVPFLEEPAEVHTGNTPGVTRNNADVLKPSPWAGLGSVKGRAVA